MESLELEAVESGGWRVGVWRADRPDPERDQRQRPTRRDECGATL